MTSNPPPSTVEEIVTEVRDRIKSSIKHGWIGGFDQSFLDDWLTKALEKYGEGQWRLGFNSASKIAANSPTEG